MLVTKGCTVFVYKPAHTSLCSSNVSVFTRIFWILSLVFPANLVSFGLRDQQVRSRILSNTRLILEQVFNVLVILLLCPPSLLCLKQVLQHGPLPHTGLLTPVSAGTISLLINLEVIVNNTT